LTQTTERCLGANIVLCVFFKPEWPVKCCPATGGWLLNDTSSHVVQTEVNRHLNLGLLKQFCQAFKQKFFFETDCLFFTEIILSFAKQFKPV